MRLLATILLCSCAASAAADLPAPAQALLDRARDANPARYQFALDQGARIFPSSDNRSFYLLWLPPDADEASPPPLIVTMHGSGSWAFDEFFLWQPHAVRAGFGILALQWWFGGPDTPEAYYSPAELHREFRAALQLANARQASALLHGFSRGSANIYGVAALDRQSGDRFYAMYLANSGGASSNFPPNLEIASGIYGYNVFSGTYWITFCGGQDPNPDRDGCPAMRRTATWIERYGGVIDLPVEDQDAGHGGFHMTPTHVDTALESFRQNLARRTGVPNPNTAWEVRPDPQFQILNASTPNVGWVRGEVWLIVGAMGPRLFRSADGSNSSTSESIPRLGEVLGPLGFGPGEVVPREDSAGNPTLYILGLAPPGTNRSALFRAPQTANGFTLNPPRPVFEGSPEDARFIGVPDVTATHDGRLRLTYVGRGSAQSNSRTAISTDDGLTFIPEFSNPFGDLAVPNPRASDINVDPAILKLANGGYLAIGMRAARLYLFSSVDGRTFSPMAQPPIEAATLSPGATGLFDPTLIQLPDGRVFFYATAGPNPGSTASRIVRAELIPPQ